MYSGQEAFSVLSLYSQLAELQTGFKAVEDQVLG